MTDPQTAADAAEPIRRLLGRAAPDADLCLSVHAARLRAFVAAHDALLADRKHLAAELKQVRGDLAAVEGAWRCWHCGSEHGPVLCTTCVDRVAEKARNAALGAETTATRPAGGSDGTGEGQRTDTPAREAQRGSQGDAVDGDGRG